MTDARVALEAIGAGPLSEIEPHIFAAGEAPPVHYDRMGWLYDAVCGTRAYNRVVWNTTPDVSRTFAQRVFDSQPTGPHVEVGCGGLLFTSHLYARDRGRPCLLIDPSLAMLRMARERLRAASGAVPRHVVLVRGDSDRLPIVDGAAASVLSMHVLHVLERRAEFVARLAGLARPGGGTIGLTSLVRTGSWRDGLLAALHRAGELAAPIDLPTLRSLLGASLPPPHEVALDGQVALVMAGR